MRNLRGFTLIELLVALVIMLVVTGSIFTLLNTTQRVSRAQAERTDLQSNVRAGAIIVPNELREINNVVAGTADQIDIITPNATSLRYRAMRGIGFVCQTPTAGEVRVKKTTWSGMREPVGGRDAGYVFMEGADANVSTDDTWQPVTITGVAASTCGAETGCGTASELRPPSASAHPRHCGWPASDAARRYRGRSGCRRRSKRPDGRDH